MKVTEFYNEYPELYEKMVMEFGDLEEINSIIENDQIVVHHDVADMSDVAYDLVQEIYDLDDLGMIANYIDYDSLGRDLEINEIYIQVPEKNIIAEILY